MKKADFTEITLTKFIEEGEFTGIGKGQTVLMAKAQLKNKEDYFHIEGAKFYKIPLASIQNYFYNLNQLEDTETPIVAEEKVTEPLKKEEVVAKFVPTVRTPRVTKSKTRTAWKPKK